ncbi:MAG: hypothetical protein JJE51_12355 [Thermoanaerobaculia bacterium]|nr:hypothetical protein [Thermoanaerobaculia bacterium]
MNDQPDDYSKYTLDQLRDVHRHISRSQFPERAASVDAELSRRIAAGEKEDASVGPHQLRRNPIFMAGLVMAFIAILQFFVAAALNALGMIDIGNGLGCGLVMWFGAGLGLLLAIVGALLHPRG